MPHADMEIARNDHAAMREVGHTCRRGTFFYRGLNFMCLSFNQRRAVSETLSQLNCKHDAPCITFATTPEVS
jgi:hypothetical protein